LIDQILGLDLIKDDGVMRECPVDLRSFEEFIQDGIDGLLAGKAVGE
jgi:hypothetical protein